MSGSTITGMARSTRTESLRLVTIIMAIAPKTRNELRSAIEMLTPKADFTCVVSAREARDDLAALRRVEVGRVERGKAPEHGGAQVRDDALAKRDDEVVTGSAREREHGDDDDQHAEIGVQDVAAALREAAVDDPAHRERQGERRGRGHRQGDERERDAAPIREGERDERLEGAERGLRTARGGCGGHEAW